MEDVNRTEIQTLNIVRLIGHLFHFCNILKIIQSDDGKFQHVVKERMY